MRGSLRAIAVGSTLALCACTDGESPPPTAEQVEPVAPVSSSSQISAVSASVIDVDGSGLGRVFITSSVTGAQSEVSPELGADGTALILRAGAGEEVSTAFGITIPHSGTYTVAVRGVWSGSVPPSGTFMRISVGSWNPPRMDAEQVFDGTAVATDGSFDFQISVVVPDAKPMPEVRVSLVSAGEVRVNRLIVTTK